MLEPTRPVEPMTAADGVVIVVMGLLELSEVMILFDELVGLLLTAGVTLTKKQTIKGTSGTLRLLSVGQVLRVAMTVSLFTLDNGFNDES